jgi:hypothetical protein
VVRGELRADGDPGKIVTRTGLGAITEDQIGGGDLSVAERRDFSGSAVFVVAPGAHSFTMTLNREVGTSQTIGFAYGNLQAELIPFSGSGALGATQLHAVLAGANENPPADPDGGGSATVSLDAQKGEVCYALAVGNIAPATLAHIHRGAAGVNGPIVVNFTAPTSGTSSGCTSADPALVAEIASNPAGFYVNVHSPEFPSGAIRGQLGK